MSKVNVEAGQWWTDIQGADPKHRLLVRGLTQTGHVICEWNGGSVSTLGMNYFLQYKKPLPKCTGWDWEPMIYPQYRETTNTHDFAYVRVDGPRRVTYILIDGTPEVEQWSSAVAVDNILARPKLTKEQAEMKIVDESMSAKNWFAESAAEPKEVPTLPPGPCHELLGPNDVPDSTTEHNYTDCNTGWRKTNTTCWFELGRTVEWYQVNKYSTVVFRRPVKPPTTRTVRVHIVEMSDGPDARFVSVGASDSDLARMRKNWKTVHVLKTDEYEVSCE